MPANLARKTAIITGTSSGIGWAIVAGGCGGGDWVCAVSAPARERERDFAGTDWAGELVEQGGDHKSAYL